MLSMTGGLWCLFFCFLVHVSSGKEVCFYGKGKPKREAAIVYSDLAGPH